MSPKDSGCKFPQLVSYLDGKEEPSLALGFIDLCGTTSYLQHFLATNGGSQGALTLLMRSFSASLVNIANEDSSLEIIQASDGAFLIGGADSVFQGIVKTIMYSPFYFFNPKKLGFIPMRAAISHGLVRVQTNRSEIPLNLSTFPYWGPAFVKVHLMEKSKVRTGIRVFGTESVVSNLRKDYRKAFDTNVEVEKVSVAGQGEENFFEANWLALVPQLSGVVMNHFGIDTSENGYGAELLAKIISIAQEWEKSADPFEQMYAKGVLELKKNLLERLP